MKKLMLVLISCMVFFAATAAAPSIVDAKGSYKSPSGSFKQPVSPAKPNSGVSKSQPGSTNKAPSGTTAPQNRGFFSGGGFMKGMLIGGLAGMLFGGMFGNMGFMGNIFGLLVNVIAIVAIFMILRAIVTYFINRRRKPDHRGY